MENVINCFTAVPFSMIVYQKKFFLGWCACLMMNVVYLTGSTATIPKLLAPSQTLLLSLHPATSSDCHMSVCVQTYVRPPVTVALITVANYFHN